MNIAIIGEAWGAEEEKERTPFIGASGYHLTKMLSEAGISRADCLVTNVFNLRPKGNRIETLCGEKRHAIEGYPLIAKSKYIRREFQPELDRLADELISADPNILILLGNTAYWAMLGKTAISKIRGYVEVSTHTVSAFKCIGTYHPAAVLRDWSLRPIVVADLIKAERESHFPDLRRPKTEIWIEPSLEDLYEFERLYLTGASTISIDIETSRQHITCVGFGDSVHGLVVPFHDARKKNRSYWPDQASETAAWRFVRRVLEDPKIRKVGQNFLYDIAFLWRAMGIRVINAEHDTMLLHHALQPESLKGLGFLGSVYTDHGQWKQLRAKNETIKRDD